MMNADRIIATPGPLLSEEERALVDALADIANRLHVVIFAECETYDIAACDWNEAALYIHGLQNMVLAQAAARAYPSKYRLMGRTAKP